MAVRERWLDRIAQPQEAAAIDYGNPLAEGLLAVMLPTDGRRNLINGFDSTTDFPVVASDYLAFSSTRAQGYFLNSGASYSPVDEHSLVMLLALDEMPTSTDIGLAGINSQWVLRANSVAGSSPNRTFKIFLTHVSVADLASSPAISGFDGQFGTIGFAGKASTDLRYFANGEFLASVSGASMNTGASTVQFGKDPQWGNSFGGRIALALYWRRKLSDAEMESVMRNPWQLFEPERIWVPVSGGAYTLTAGSGAFALTGNPATLTAARALSASTGAFTLAGKDATLRAARAITASTGNFTLTGKDAGLTTARLLSAGVGTYTLIGKDATFAVGGTGNYVLAASTGAFSLTGKVSELAAQRKIAAGTGAVALTGYNAALDYRRGLIAETGSFALTLKPGTLTTTGTVTATSAPPGGGKSKSSQRRRRVMLRGQMYEVAERDIPALIEAVLRDSTPPGTAEVVSETPQPTKPKKPARKAIRTAQDTPAEQPSIDMVAERIALLQAELTRQAEADVARMLDRVAQRVLAELQDEEDALVALLFA